MSRNGSSPIKKTAIVAGIIIALALIIGLIDWQASSFGSTDGGHVAVVRNGGPLDNTRIRQVLAAGSSRTNIGYDSTLHPYPTSQRFFTISGKSGNADSNDVVTVPTADGFQVGIEGTAYFTLNTGTDNGYAILKEFDNKYGTRTFRCTNGNASKHVYDGDTGFSCFLDQIVSPIINNDLRVSIGDLHCADLVASCSLVQNTSGIAQIDATKIGKGNVNLAKIEQTISSSLQDDLNQTLGGNYLQVERFNLSGVDLPDSVQKAIEAAQAAFASVTSAQADLKKAQIEAQANAAKQKGYTACPACAQQDLLAKLPQGITVYAPGNPNIAIPTK